MNLLSERSGERVRARLSRAMVNFFGRVRGVAEILCYKTRLSPRADHDTRS